MLKLTEDEIQILYPEEDGRRYVSFTEIEQLMELAKERLKEEGYMNQKNNAHHRRFFVKGLIILLLLGMNYLMFSFFFSSVVEDITYDNESRRDTACWN